MHKIQQLGEIQRDHTDKDLVKIKFQSMKMSIKLHQIRQSEKSNSFCLNTPYLTPLTVTIRASLGATIRNGYK